MRGSRKVRQREGSPDNLLRKSSTFLTEGLTDPREKQMDPTQGSVPAFLRKPLATWTIQSWIHELNGIKQHELKVKFR